MEYEYQHKGIVLATDHFIGRDRQIVLLAELMSDEEVSQHVSGLWMPKNTIDNATSASTVAQISYASRAQYSQQKIAEGRAPKTKLIYDTSSSGGVPDTLHHINSIVEHFPAPKMIFTVSVGAFAEVIEATRKMKEYEYEKNGNEIHFLLATAYPENDIDSIRKFTKMDVDEYTDNVSRLADEYGMAGVVGAGDLARHTRVGQYFLALGVCANGAKDYEVKTEPWGAINKKRMVSPEDTFRFATDTEIQLSRTLFDSGDGTFMFPNDELLSRDREEKILSLVKSNFLSVVQRLEDLPPPLERTQQLALF